MTAGVAAADELTLIAQQDLAALGYDPGAIDGNYSPKTAVAVSKFQAEHGLQVTGEVTPQLVGIIRAVDNNKYQPAPVPGQAPPGAPPTGASAASHAGAASAEANLRARRQACLEEKAAAKEERKKKKRGFGRLARVAGRVAGRFALGGNLVQAAHDIYETTTDLDDLSEAAKELGLTQGDVEECRNPPMGASR
jgi:peptidoglycan hydrolase-like protein with peptidoglycan-binding domain